MTRWRALLLLAIFCLAFPGRAAAQDPVERVETIEVAQVDNTRYPDVTIYVRALDAAGQRVDGLEQGNFAIREDDQPVEVTAFSGVNYASIRTMLLIDKSSSMQYEDKLTGAKKAAAAFIDLMRSQDQAAIIAFDNGVNLIQDFTGDHELLKSQVNALAIGDCTSWYEAIYFASGIMKGVEGRKTMLLLSDGIDCREDWTLHVAMGYGSYHSFEEALDQARQAETPVVSIALGREPAEKLGNEGYDEGRLRRMADGSGGQYRHAPTVEELAEIYRGLSVQTQEEYVLTYRSPRPTYDGTRRNIQVTVVAASGEAASGQDEQASGPTASRTYLEEHLITIESDWRIAGLALAPLLLAALAPLVFLALRRPRPAGREVVPGPPPEPGGTLACAQCGHMLRPGARFCPVCGQPVTAAPAPAPASQSCPNCGHPLRAGAGFCPKCGVKVPQ